MKKRKIIIGSAAALTAAATFGSCGIFEAPQQSVYGPPPYSETEKDTEPEYDTEPAGTTSAGDFRPEDNEPVDIYGPPEMFGTDDEEEEEAADTEEAFETTFAAEENTAAPLYGPPEMFGIENTNEQVTTDDR